MNYTLLAFLTYAIVTAIGMVGLGNIFWSVIKTSCPSPKHSAPTEHPLFIVGLSFFLGYLLYEEFFYLLAAAQLFSEALVTIAGGLLTVTGIGWLIRKKLNLQKQARILVASPLETAVLTSMFMFVYFWNLYPMYDVDSMHDYLPSIVNLLKHGGLYFSPYEWVIHFGPRAENMVYGLGLALKPDSSIFPQQIHGISKVMMLLIVYGAARTMGLESLSLLAPAFIMSEEHIVASGTNVHVHINMAYALALFLMYYSIFHWIKHENLRYFWISLNAALFAILCKYNALYHLVLYVVIITVMCILHRDIRRALLLQVKPRIGILQTVVSLVATIPFLFRFSTTGSPFFPINVGPFKTNYYDDVYQFLLSVDAWALSFSDAIKNLTAFMVWPGILSLKILGGLALLSACTTLLVAKNAHKFVKHGFIFFILTVLIVIVQQISMAGEMRYYRFGIGIYAISATFFIAAILLEVFALLTWPKFFTTLATWLTIVSVSLYCVRYSFDVMRHRATYQNIIAFTSGTISESAIMAERWPPGSYSTLQNLALNERELGLLLTMGWPEFVNPVPGRQIAFGKTGALPSYAYFDTGSFAYELQLHGIKTVFNQLANSSDYPFPGGVAYEVLQQCGHPLIEASTEFLELSSICLEDLASQRNSAAGVAILNSIIKDIQSRPTYRPFVTPPFGGGVWLR